MASKPRAKPKHYIDNKTFYTAIIKYKNEVDEVRVREITTDIINKTPSLGSYTGWYVTVKNDMIKHVKDTMEI